MLLTILYTYLVLMNALGLVLMHADKKKARRGAWRIPEAVLMSTALWGGSIGCIAGMYCFRHKTRHPKFYLGLPLILAVQVGLALLLVRSI